MEVAKLDKNFSRIGKIDEKDCVFYDIKENKSFDIYGFYDVYNTDKFIRLPEDVAEKGNKYLRYFNEDTAGGRIRFKTDSKYVAIRVKMPYVKHSHQPLSGSSGFTMYLDKNGKSEYFRSFIPPVEFEEGYVDIIRFPDKKERNITIYFPLYSHVNAIQIGLQNSASLKNGKKYRVKKPIVFYGGSHVQGACASVPSNSTSAFVSRMLDADFINLGFSSGALGEQEIAEYIANLDMSAFVCEYDHNAPTVEHLNNTHYKFLKTIVEKKPNIPIIFTSKHDYYICSFYVKTQQENIDRRKIVIETYDRLKEEGHDNIFFIDGKTIFSGRDKFACTVDGTHPNDLGFFRMACKFEKILKKYL